MSRAVLAMGTKLVLRGIRRDKTRLFENRGQSGEINPLIILWEEVATVTLNFVKALNNERPTIRVAQSPDAIWTPHDWHEMVRTCAGLSCITSHGVGICRCHSFSVLKSPSYCSGLADLTSRRTLVWPKEAPRFEVVVASNNPAVNTYGSMG